MSFAAITESTALPAALRAAAETLTSGGLVVITDPTALNGAGRGFFLQVAALATTETVNTAILHGRGLTCFSVTPEQAMRLGLMMAGEYRADRRGPLFLRSVEAAECDGTGISAEDRALTLRAAGSPTAGMASLKSPGHVVPAMTGSGATREVADLALEAVRLLTDYDVPAWTDILDDEGEVAGTAWCQALAGELGLRCLSAGDLGI